MGLAVVAATLSSTPAAPTPVGGPPVVAAPAADAAVGEVPDGWIRAPDGSPVDDGSDPDRPPGPVVATPDPVVDAQVIGGTRVRRDELPWASLLVIERPEGLAQCGGSLIAPRWILTAAHCLAVDGGAVAGGAVRAVVGATRRPETLADDRWVRSVEVYVRSDYDPATLANDVALVRLARRIRRRPLPIVRPDEGHLLAAGTRATVAGWGRTRPDSGVSTYLRKATVPIRRARRCRSVFPGFRRELQLCAGWLRSEASSPAGSCQGDSGSALTVFTRFGPTQVGIVSYGRGACTLLGRPGVYARPDVHRDSIVELIGSLPPPPPTPTCAGRRATLAGTIGDDVLAGTARRDVVVARAGADDVSALGGRDLVCLGAGRDVARVGGGTDRVLGGPGPDVLRGRAGPDRLVGGAGPDTLDGGPGRDRCHGGPGRDRAVRCEIRISAR